MTHTDSKTRRAQAFAIYTIREARTSGQREQAKAHPWAETQTAGMARADQENSRTFLSRHWK